MPFSRRHESHADPVQDAEERIAAPLARLEERLMTVSSSLDGLVEGLEDVAMQIRQMARQVAERAGDIDG